MRALTAVAVLILAAGIAPSVALPLPGSTSEHAALTGGVRPLPAVPQPPPAPQKRPKHRPKPLILGPPPLGAPGPRPPPAPPDPAPEPLPLYPSRGAWPGTAGLQPQTTQRFGCFRQLWGKLLCRAPIATSPSDEVFGQPNSRRELLERFDELLIELVARAYEDSEELPTTSRDDLD